MAKSETVTRYELSRRISPTTTVNMNVYLDDDNLNIGNEVTLVDDVDNFRWTIIKKHETIARRSINQRWNNNI